MSNSNWSDWVFFLFIDFILLFGVSGVKTFKLVFLLKQIIALRIWFINWPFCSRIDFLILSFVRFNVKNQYRFMQILSCLEFNPSFLYHFSCRVPRQSRKQASPVSLFAEKPKNVLTLFVDSTFNSGMKMRLFIQFLRPFRYENKRLNDPLAKRNCVHFKRGQSK